MMPSKMFTEIARRPRIAKIAKIARLARIASSYYIIAKLSSSSVPVQSN